MQVLQLLGTILLLLAVFAALRWLWRFVAGLFAARKKVEAHKAVEAPGAVVTLIHGTFARKASWTLPGSRLCTALERHFAGKVQLTRFEWSGRNSFGARERAVGKLTEQLAAARERWPGVPHYLVGHSHGGSVALGGAMGSARSCVDGVVCLATPVITTRRRRFSRVARTVIGLGFFVTLVIPWIDFESEAEATDFDLAVMVISAILAFVWYRTARRLADRLCDTEPYSRLDPDRVAFIRSPFDEASGVIGLANVLSWIVGRLTAGPFDLFASFERLKGWRRLRSILGYAALAGGSVLLALLPDLFPAAEAALQGSSWLDFTHALLVTALLLIGVSGSVLALLAPILRWVLHNKVARWLLAPFYLYAMLIVAFFFVPAIVLMSLAHAAAVGVELLLCSVLVEVTAEPCPAGNWTVYQLRPSAEGSLRHSSVYESDAGLAALVLALDGIASDDPVPLMSDQLRVPAAAPDRAVAI